MASFLSNGHWILICYFAAFKVILYLEYAESTRTVDKFSEVTLFSDLTFHKHSFNRYQTETQSRTYELKTEYSEFLFKYKINGGERKGMPLAKWNSEIVLF